MTFPRSSTFQNWGEKSGALCAATSKGSPVLSAARPRATCGAQSHSRRVPQAPLFLPPTITSGAPLFLRSCAVFAASRKGWEINNLNLSRLPQDTPSAMRQVSGHDLAFSPQHLRAEGCEVVLHSYSHTTLPQTRYPYSRGEVPSMFPPRFRSTSSSPIAALR